MTTELSAFRALFSSLTGHTPMRWQERLFGQVVQGKFPSQLDLPTGLGKTSVMVIWLVARALADDEALKRIPRRLVYIVDRRAVVDQATAEAEKLRDALDGGAAHLKTRLRLDDKQLPISTLRGSLVDNRKWLDDPSVPAIVIGTVDKTGSRIVFEGYDVPPKMRAFHAGLIGVDALIVLDEAHLVPPFTKLLQSIQNDPSLWPEDRALLPPFIVLPLSATQRAGTKPENGRISFGLADEDWHDETAAQRLNAHKQLRVEPLAEKEQDRQFAEAAFALATQHGPARVAVFCNRRERKDDGSGPSAQGVAETIAELAKENKKTGREKTDIHPVELLVGARRVFERDQVACRLKKLGFIGSGGPSDKPAFLVATSAGEVGVDIDADHMVCDLVEWERMVQRLGRVNRRGRAGHEAQVVVFDTSSIEKDEQRSARLAVGRNLLSRIETDLGGKTGPAALLELRRRVDPQEIGRGSTPEPLHPSLTRALADAWSMTSLERHAGRPEVAPWLRGWEEKTPPQTTVVWRTYLPVREGVSDWPLTPSQKKEVDDFFEAAEPRESERLETETFRVADWLQARARALLKRKTDKSDETEAAETAISEDTGADADNPATDEAQPDTPSTPLRRHDVALFVLAPDGSYADRYTLHELQKERKGRAKDDFEKTLAEKTLVVDARLGGLEDGLLNPDADINVPTADMLETWSEQAGFRVSRRNGDDKPDDEAGWWDEKEFVLRHDVDADPKEWLVVQRFREATGSEDGRSVSRPQTLADHQALAEQIAERIGKAVGLSGPALEALTLAAAVHDEGKRAPRWQRAFKASRDARKYNLTGPLAKTCGPIDQKLLDGYRHECGSVAVFDLGHESAKRLSPEMRQRIANLPEEWRELSMHLVAAHHGRSRPMIGTRGCEDDPPTALEARAHAVALRFAELQKRWGPWGLAWWESLLRAADQQASRENDNSAGAGERASRKEET